ncbi:MAG TPA: winged helix-turn-helix domain-containing protein [Aliidongia sp.]|nr:winged helix-turn-helix domain-containing protein [Aliidongia sp.]
MMTAKHEHVIGRYRLRPGRGLDADCLPVALGVKALGILTALVEAEGELVTKDELLERVWPGLVVEEHNIQVHISALRKALGEEAGWIVTVPRLGYRFVGPLGRTAPAVSLLRPFGRLFGREEDLATIRSLLEGARLVTVAGPGGIGKTRIALELVHGVGGRYRDGAVFVDLSVLEDPSLVSTLVATALRIELKGDRPQPEQLARRLKERELLIVLDNCEHLLGAVAPLAELILAEAPRVSLLATSRESLACQGEQVYRLPLLPVPADDLGSTAEMLAGAAVALLVDRLKAADPHFELTDRAIRAAGGICRRLDGLPLAVEMVGALASDLGLETTAARLEQSFSLPYSVSRTAEPRHRSLEATLDWSHALLSPAERMMLRRLSVFPGPFSLEAVEAVASGKELPRSACGDLLITLVRKSLVSIDPVAPLPYRLLETIRTYAAEKLEDAGERRALHERHARCVADKFKSAIRDWHEANEGVWCDRYAWLLADLRAALRWSFGTDGNLDLGLAITGQSTPLWHVLRLDGEGRRWAETAASSLTDATSDEVAAYVWMAVGYLMPQRSFERSVFALRRAADLFGILNDTVERGTTLAMTGQLLALSGDAAAAKAALTEARLLLERGASKRSLGLCAMGFGVLHTEAGSRPEARREFDRARTLFQAVDSTRTALAASCNLAEAIWVEGDLEAAIATVKDALELARRARIPRFVGHASGCLAGMLTERGELDEALIAARTAMPLCRENEHVLWLFPHLALRAAKAGRPEEAARLWGYFERVNHGALSVSEGRALDALRAVLHDRLPPGRAEELREAGRYLSEDQAVDLALA